MNALASRNRKAHPTIIRAIAAAYMHDYLFDSLSYRELGRLLGGRDCGTAFTLASRGRFLLQTSGLSERMEVHFLVGELLGLGAVREQSPPLPPLARDVDLLLSGKAHRKQGKSQPKSTAKPTSYGVALEAALRFKKELMKALSNEPNGTITISVVIKFKNTKRGMR